MHKYPDIPVGEDQIVCILRLWTMGDRQSGCKFLIPVPDNFSAEQYAATFETYLVPTMGYPYFIVFDRDTLFISSHFHSWAASKGIKLKPSAIYHAQTDNLSEIVNKEIIQVARSCEGEGNEWLSKILKIQLRLNSRYNASHRNNPFVTGLSFDAKLGLNTFRYTINNYDPATEYHNATSQA